MTLSNPAQYISGRTVQEQMNSLIDYVDQRAADVALDAIASDVAQVHQDMLDADADAAAAAASAAAAAGTLANAVKKTGEASQSIAGDIAVSGALSGGSVATAGNVTVGGTLGVTGAATLSSGATVPTEATGTFSTKAANSTKVKNELDAYAPMLRTSGNQNFSGVKKASGTGFYRKTSSSLDLANPPTSGTVTDETYVLEDTQGSTIVQNFNSFTAGAQTIYQVSTKHPFIEGGVAKKVTGALWLAVYDNRAVLYIRFTDKSGTSHMKTVMTVSETDP